MQWKKGALTLVAVGLLAAPSTAFAAGNVSNIEQKWIDFHKALTDRMVQDGKLTRAEADDRVAKLTEEAQKSTDDVVYERFANRAKPMRDGANDREKRLMKEYAALTGRTTEEVRQACEKAHMTVWELAASEGKLDNLKLEATERMKEHLQSKVKDGKLTQQEADQRLAELQEKLEKHL